MILLWVALVLLLLTFMVHLKKEGLEDDYLGLAIKSIETAMEDERMKKEQLFALQDALTYANYIKNI
jgi:hypothetical protein